MTSRVASPRALLYLLLLAAAARLVLQASVMPPYAGLDELFHVARLAFQAEERRAPTMLEASVPRYLARSAAGDPGAPPAFGLLGARWPTFAAEAERWVDPPLTASDTRDYVAPNYEAQQPFLYYAAAAPLAHRLGGRAALRELLVWRGLSVACSLLVVLATALIATRAFGTAGLVAAALLAATPTWLTLVVRASNDAAGCAMLAVALCLSSRVSRRPRWWVAEGLAWAAAIATKAFAWPLVILVPILWRGRRVSLGRAAIVVLCGAFSGLVTMTDLSLRTSNPLGEQGFTSETANGAGHDLAVAAMARVFVSSAIWPGAQHGNALRPAGMLLYAAPLLGLAITGLTVGLGASPRTRRALAIAAVALAAFGVAQLVHAYGFIRHAMAIGVHLPAGGMEGWYLFSLAPILFGLALAPGIRGLVTRNRILVWGLVGWGLAWDLVIHEGALFRDYAGLTAPAHPGFLLRWGDLEGLTAGSLLDLSRLSAAAAAHPGGWLIVGLRAVHVTLTVVLVAAALARVRPRGRRLQ